jgi:hypothetical protein
MGRLDKQRDQISGKTIKISLRQRIKALLQEINGLSPYEKNIINYLKLGKEKKAIKFAKKRLGNIKRAKIKIEFLNNLTRFN